MTKLTEDQANALPEPTTRDVIGGYVRRYWDMVALGRQNASQSHR